jgi:gamma-glutamyltranspeptidase/glutathione hydrolase
MPASPPVLSFCLVGSSGANHNFNRAGKDLMGRRAPFAIMVVMGLLAPGIPSEAKTLKPVVSGRRGVVAAGHPLVAEAGLRILHQGGNAVDAGVATVFAAAVVELSGFGMGGECPILIKPRGGPVVAVNGAGIAPKLATVEFYQSLSRDDPRLAGDATMARGRRGIIPSYGPLSAIVPSAVDSLLLALENYGTLSLADVIQPAIELAHGFPLHPALEGAFERSRATFAKWPSTARVYTPEGRLPKEGEVFVQADLARTLESMAAVEAENARQGRVAALETVRDFFYRGPVARRISEFCQQSGCLLREDDFAAYRARIENPLRTSYHGIEVYKVGFWSQSPVFLENLNLLEGFDLKSAGHNSAAYIHTVVEAMKLGYADRDTYYGDPEFSSIPLQLISKEYAAVRRTLLDPARASAEHIPGDPADMKARAAADFARARLSQRNAETGDTTCVNVIDQHGNMFSATPSGAWIPAVIAGDTGIPLSQRMQSFVLTPGHPNRLVPHKRPRITLTPTLALREGVPYLAFSTPGGDSQDQTLLQVFLNVVEFGMNPQEAVEAPRFNSLAMYSSFDDHSDQPLALEIENRVPEPVLEQLRAWGHKLAVQGGWENPTAPTMVQYDARSGVIRAGADARGHRYALAW